MQGGVGLVSDQGSASGFAITIQKSNRNKDQEIALQRSGTKALSSAIFRS
jgi:hypothetical protein